MMPGANVPSSHPSLLHANGIDYVYSFRVEFEKQLSVRTHYVNTIDVEQSSVYVRKQYVYFIHTEQSIVYF